MPCEVRFVHNARILHPEYEEEETYDDSFYTPTTVEALNKILAFLGKDDALSLQQYARCAVFLKRVCLYSVSSTAFQALGHVRYCRQSLLSSVRAGQRREDRMDS